MESLKCEQSLQMSQHVIIICKYFDVGMPGSITVVPFCSSFLQLGGINCRSCEMIIFLCTTTPYSMLSWIKINGGSKSRYPTKDQCKLFQPLLK